LYSRHRSVKRTSARFSYTFIPTAGNALTDKLLRGSARAVTPPRPFGGRENVRWTPRRYINPRAFFAGPVVVEPLLLFLPGGCGRPKTVGPRNSGADSPLSFRAPFRGNRRQCSRRTVIKFRRVPAGIRRLGPTNRPFDY